MLNQETQLRRREKRKDQEKGSARKQKTGTRNKKRKNRKDGWKRKL